MVRTSRLGKAQGAQSRLALVNVGWRIRSIIINCRKLVAVKGSGMPCQSPSSTSPMFASAFQKIHRPGASLSLGTAVQPPPANTRRNSAKRPLSREQHAFETHGLVTGE